MKSPTRPPWLKVPVRTDPGYERVADVVRDLGVGTVCRESDCPNIWECWSKREISFLILGDICTRACRYCRVIGGEPDPPDALEAAKIARVILELRLTYAVVTSVTRDDLPDKGAGQFAAVARAIREAVEGCRIELLVPDFGGDDAAAGIVRELPVDTIGHNIETVPRLFSKVRPGSDYRRSLVLLETLRAKGPRGRQRPVKSGLMVGMGETRAEVREALRDLRAAGVDFVTVGQYLPPTKDHLQTVRYWRPEEFIGLAVYARKLGFSRILSGPLVRSSYRGPTHAKAVKEAV